MESKTYSVKLTIHELVLLHRHCRPEIQSVVDKAVLAITIVNEDGLPEHQAAMISEILSEAKSKGKLTHVCVSVRTCPCCGRNEGYYPVKRTTATKTKGSPDYDRPIHIQAWDVSRGFVVMQGHISVGFCAHCRNSKFMTTLQRYLDSVEAEIPESLLGAPCKWKRHDNMKCEKCGWEGHEGQMKRLRTLMGDGDYPGECPGCGAKNLPFGWMNIKSTGSFTVVAI